MRYDQVDQALEFLDEGSFVILQVPYMQDIRLVNEYLVCRLKPQIVEWSRQVLLLTGGRKIYIEVLGGNDFAGYGVSPGKVFLIDRLNDRSYMDRLEVTGCV